MTTSVEIDFARERERMVERQLRARGVADPAVLAAMRAVPREAFVPEGLAEFAYDDGPLPIGEGQTISQPYIVALMIEAAEPRPGDRALEIGAGSGYAAAVLGRVVAEVDTVERHAALAEAARARLERLGYANVRVHHGDGTLGWPERAPYDVILVTAGGPGVPEALRHQLAVGGRLVMPVGDTPLGQRLIRLRRTGEDAFEQDEPGAAVAFVPLVGEQGWREGGNGAAGSEAGSRADPIPRSGSPPPAASPPRRPVGEAELARMIRDAAEPLPDPADPAFGPPFDRLLGGDARVILLGEATHGTSEFYRARARITRRLVEEHGFTVVAAEADWPDAARIDAYIRGREPASAAEEEAFARFPTWMWRNAEFRELVDWLHGHNAGIAEPKRRVSFHGLDLYSLNASVRAVLDYLDRVDPEAARVARERYGCLTPWQRDPATYGRMALRSGYAPCEREVVRMLRDLLDRRLEYVGRDHESFLDAEQNARIVAEAERYYRIMYYGSAESWNLRDRHMFDTLLRVLEARGPESKAVVWAHNSHIGNAAATEMGTLREELNIGQLCRERFGERARLVGFGTDRGTVAAASDWDEPMEIKRVRPAHRDSYERLCRDAGVPRFLLDLRPDGHEDLRYQLLRPRLERAIGVIYRPETELASHYFEASLPRQFDAYIWFEETTAVTPLGPADLSGVPETYPFGV